MARTRSINSFKNFPAPGTGSFRVSVVARRDNYEDWDSDDLKWSQCREDWLCTVVVVHDVRMLKVMTNEGSEDSDPTFWYLKILEEFPYNSSYELRNCEYAELQDGPFGVTIISARRACCL